MVEAGQKEKITQNRVIELFQYLGYSYLGNWQGRQNNRNIETEILSQWLKGRGVSDTLIAKTLRELDRAATLGESQNLYDANKAVYRLLRYGVKVKEEAGEQTETVWLLDWERPEENEFAIAEEVTVKGQQEKRPDIVLYINGIALGILELKRASFYVSKGIRQNLDNQKKEFIRSFFSTIQLLMAGNDSQGLRYGTIETSEKYYLQWQEENPAYNPQSDRKEEKYRVWSKPVDNNGILQSGDPPKPPLKRGARKPPLVQGGVGGGSSVGTLDCALDCALVRLCNKARFLELLHNFIIFDKGTKKTCRPHQYFAIKAAQKFIARREGGIIWHSQGSGKSLSMVWLAKWIRENSANARILIITDRVELDEQIEGIFKGVDEDIYRTKSGSDLIQTLDRSAPWLVCSLIHKFGRRNSSADDEFIRELQSQLPSNFAPKGNIFVFVDECHRSQSAKLHKAMKDILPDALFIGFTGTPLLKTDKKSIEVFGNYIHTYKFDEAVADGIVLDLRYEARDIDQALSSQSKIDIWFEAKTRGLSELAKSQLKRKWGTMQKVLSSKSRLEQIVSDILLDMETKPRLSDGRGNAILVCSSIYQACKSYELFCQAGLRGKCAIITSYQPSKKDIKGEETGEGLTEKLHQYEIYRRMLADYFNQPEDKAMYRLAEFETQVRKRFVAEPGQMRLLILVNKLLTGFDAPSATYLYIDKTMRDHGLFQAICRVNRLDGEDKEYGYIVDYKDLFKQLAGAVTDYTSGAFDGYDAAEVAGLLKSRLQKGRDRLEETLETVRAIVEPVPPPRELSDYLHYFCRGENGDRNELARNEPKRVALYKAIAALVRAYSNLAGDAIEAGYTAAEAKSIKAETDRYSQICEEVKIHSSDYLDMKLYEPGMRHLLDTYIRAEPSQVVSDFEELGLIELIVKNGSNALEVLPDGLRQSQEATAETIENNMRKIIAEKTVVNPKYYERLSELLDALIAQRRQKTIGYQKYMERIKELAKQVLGSQGNSEFVYPPSLDTPAKRSLYDNLGRDEALALSIDAAVRSTKKDSWVGNRFKEREVAAAIRTVIGDRDIEVAPILELVKNQAEYR